MSRLTRDGPAEPVSRDQIFRHARGQGNVHFPCSADHEQDWQPYPFDPYSAICDDHTYIHTVPSVHIYVLTTDPADHEQVWQPFANDPYYSAISKWWPYLLALYINTDHQQ